MSNALDTYGAWHNFVAGKTTAQRLVAFDENEWYTPAGAGVPGRR